MASPQVLSRGKTDLSKIKWGIFSLLRKSEAVVPAGPAPAMAISIV
jgi:hypothetical protein